MSVSMDLGQAAAAMSGKLLGADGRFKGVSTDSRKIGAGELFVALRGERFDGHDYVELARDRGAVAAVIDVDGVSRLREVQLPLVVVSDTRLALGELAADWRARFTVPVIAVTGSNGKTTTREMIASILRSAFDSAVLATVGNLNNDIGLPLTLLGLDATHRAVAVEMGMNHPGEIAYLARVARPTVAVVTNAQRAHLEGMGTLETIAIEKGSLFRNLAEDGVAVFSADDGWADLWHQQSAGHRTFCFTFGGEAEVVGRARAHGLENRLTIAVAGEEVEVALAVPGIHNAQNALAAAAAALAAGVPLGAVRDGLAAFGGVKGRLQRRAGRQGATLLDDSYNANPDSVRAGIDVLAATVGTKILVLGDMGEIGAMTGQYHDEIGGYAKSQGIDRLFAFGESSALAALNFGVGGQHFKKIEDLIEALAGELSPETTVLIKGSRFMRMERVADAVAASDKENESCC